MLLQMGDGLKSAGGAFLRLLGPKPLIAIIAWTWIACMALLTGRAGYNFDGEVWGAMMVLCTLAAALIPNESITAFRSGALAMGVLFGLGGIGFMLGEGIGHSMVVSGTRDREAHEANIQKVRWEDARKSVTQLEKKLEDLRETQKTQIAYGDPASYDSQIADAEAKIVYETKNIRCDKKCEDWRTKASDLRAKKAIALARVSQTEPAIFQAEKELAEARSVSGKTDSGFSKTKAHAKTVASILYQTSSPTEEQINESEHKIHVYFIILGVIGAALLHTAAHQSFEKKGPKGPGALSRLWRMLTRRPDTNVEAVRQQAANLMFMDPRSAAQRSRQLGKCA